MVEILAEAAVLDAEPVEHATYAILKNGKVDNITVADAAFADKQGWVRIEDGFGVGDLHDGKDFVHPVIAPLDYSAEDQKAVEAALAEPGSVVRALAFLTLQELNALRSGAGLKPYTPEQFTTALQAKMRD